MLRPVVAMLAVCSLVNGVYDPRLSQVTCPEGEVINSDSPPPRVICRPSPYLCPPTCQRVKVVQEEYGVITVVTRYSCIIFDPIISTECRRCVEEEMDGKCSDSTRTERQSRTLHETRRERPSQIRDETVHVAMTCFSKDAIFP